MNTKAASSPASSASSAAASPRRLEVTKREIRGVTVTFYKRKTGGCWVADFMFRAQRSQEATLAFTLKDAEAVAALRIEQRQREANGLAGAERERKRSRMPAGPVATVGDVLAALDGPQGRSFWPNEGTRRSYSTGLRQLAAAAGGGEALKLDRVLNREVIEGFQAARQGLAAVNTRLEIAANGGANSTLRNVRAIFEREAAAKVLAGLTLPDLEEMRAVPFLKWSPQGFQEWPAEVYRAFDEGAARLREFDAGGPLVPGMLVAAVYLPRGHEGRELAGKAGVLLELGESTGRVQWVWRGGEVVALEIDRDKLRAVTVDYGELWLVNVMLRRLGLRAAELLAARRSWLEQRPTRDGRQRWHLVVKDRLSARGTVESAEHFKLLKGSAPRNLQLDDELAALLLARAPGYLIGPDMAETARFDLVERLHNTWLRQFIPDRVKANHELRMWAGSLVYRQTGNLGDAQYYLGHRSAKTTADYYAAWWQSSASLDGAAVAAA